MPVAYVALGSNLGDKKAYLEDALSRMKVHLSLIHISEPTRP